MDRGRSSDELSIPDTAEIEREDLELVLEEAGYGMSFRYSSSDHFGIKDPHLNRPDLFSGNMDAEEHDERGSMSRNISSEEATIKQIQIMEKQRHINQFLLGQAAASQGAKDSTPPQTPKKKRKDKREPVEDASPIFPLETEIEKIAAHLISVKASRGEQDVGTSVGDLKIKKAKDILNLSPRRGLYKTNEEEWQRMASEYIDENKVTQTTVPTSPNQIFRMSNLSLLNSPVTLREQESPNRGSPTYLNRPGSRIIAGPGKSTAILKLKPGEDAATVTQEYLADPNAFFGFSGPAKSEVAAVQGSSNQASSESEVILTPPSPPTMGRRTPSQEQEKQTPPSPSIRHCPRSGKNLISTFNEMKGMANSALYNGATTDKLSLADRRQDGPAQSDRVQKSPGEDNVVGYWNQNSGAKNFDVPDEFEEDKTEGGNILDLTGEYVAEEEDNTTDLRKPPGTLSQGNVSEDLIKANDNQIRVVVTTEEVIEVIPSTDVPAVSTDIHSEIPTADQIMIDDRDPNTQEIVEHAAHSPEHPGSLIKSTEHITQPGDEPAKSPQSSPNTSTSASPDVQSFTPHTFDSFTENSSSISTTDIQNEFDYPSLSRGRGRGCGSNNHSRKGGKSGSPTRSDYAAVAKKKLGKKEEDEMQGLVNKKVGKTKKKAADDDGWAVKAEETWGFRGGKKGSGSGNGKMKVRGDE